MNFKIDEEFRAYLPPQTPEETAALTRKILVEKAKPGSLVVAVLPEGRFLIDGHHTLAICQANKINPPEEQQIVLADREAVFAWMRENQLARRNLTPEQRAYFIGKEYEAAKKMEGRPSGKPILPQNEVVTAKKIAEKNKTSRATVERAAQFAASVDKIASADPEAKAAILSGRGATKADVIAAGKSLCERCKRIGTPTKGCQQCADAAADALKKPRPKPPQPPDFDDPSDEEDAPPPKAAKPKAGYKCPTCGRKMSSAEPIDTFDEFWDAYPRKVGKKDAQKAWNKLNPAPSLSEAIIADVVKRTKSREWTKDDGQFIPHPATYLNGERWTDEGIQKQIDSGSLPSDFFDGLKAFVADGDDDEK